MLTCPQATAAGVLHHLRPCKGLFCMPASNLSLHLTLASTLLQVREAPSILQAFKGREAALWRLVEEKYKRSVHGVQPTRNFLLGSCDGADGVSVAGRRYAGMLYVTQCLAYHVLLTHSMSADLFGTDAALAASLAGGDLPSDIPHGAGVSPHTVTPFTQYGAPVHVGLLLGLTCGVCYARNLLAEAVAEDPAGELARAVPPQWIRDDHARACQVRMSVRLWLAALMSCWVCRFAWRNSPSRAAATIAGDAGGVSAVIVLLPNSASVSLSSVTSSRFAIVGTALGCSTGSGFVRCAYRELAAFYRQNDTACFFNPIHDVRDQRCLQSRKRATQPLATPTRRHRLERRHELGAIVCHRGRHRAPISVCAHSSHSGSSDTLALRHLSMPQILHRLGSVVALSFVVIKAQRPVRRSQPCSAGFPAKVPLHGCTSVQAVIVRLLIACRVVDRYQPNSNIGSLGICGRTPQRCGLWCT